MSYSFRTRGTNKADAIQKVKEELAAVVKAQPIHSYDEQLARAAARSFIDSLVVETGQDIEVRLAGSISRNEAGTQQASLNLTVANVAREDGTSTVKASADKEAAP
jgi:nickel-dependent lactate racemase